MPSLFLGSKQTQTVTGQKAVAAAGTRERLTSLPYRATSLTLKALKGTTNLVYKGGMDVSSTVGDEISPGGIRNYVAEEGEVIILSDVFLDAAVNGEGVSFEFIPA